MILNVSISSSLCDVTTIRLFMYGKSQWKDDDNCYIDSMYSG